MKKNIIQKISLILSGIVILTFIACDDYLDVRPKSQIPIETHFERESGFADQLTGVYTKMCEEPLYGRQMTFGLMEVLAQNYNLYLGSEYVYASVYQYTEVETKSMIDSLWENSYNAIANLNVMLQYIDKADRNIFTENHYEVYKGEALGLRAFLHLDLLRIFSPSYASNPSGRGIPYVTQYAPKIVPKGTVTQSLDSIIADLNRATVLLESDSLRISPSPYTHRSRRKYFNYFAAEATLARAYLYKGDKVNALKHAEIIIKENEKEINSALTWTHFTAIETTYEYECDRTYSTEHIFQLGINDMEDIVNTYFTSKAGSNTLSPSDDKADLIYEKSEKGYGNDYRMDKNFKYDGERTDRYLSKFWQYENGRYNKIFPIIRLTEAYYIAAEALKDTDSKKAIEYLNLVRSHRKLSEFPLSETLTPDEIQKEIYKEYRKEFLGEGQLFFYYKRLNERTIDGAGVVANDNIYVLPQPDNEEEFGQ